MQLIDSHNRIIDYVRLAVTDRCNLRCTYCMPAHGIDFVQRKELLSYEEMLRLLKILKTLGVNKLRITGGEPLVRKDLIPFLQEVTNQKIIDGYHLTTNATLTLPRVQDLINCGLKTINISLDSLDREQYKTIARRDDLQNVLDSIYAFYEQKIPIKINMVVMKGVNEKNIITLAELAKNNFIDVRFLEEMPFNGLGEIKSEYYSHQEIEGFLTSHFGPLELQKVEKSSTSKVFLAAGFKGKLGVIPSFSRTFCGTCNRLRITPTGVLKTCLYGKGELNLKTLLTNGSSDAEITTGIIDAVARKPKNGFEAEAQRNFLFNESMASIGG
ncbi:MAG: GTP 3',8-cyclase MoaA [Flavobacteriales bacterium]|nr:GTP 3',8-cyclase MoaA [Flavobacteriales bacterium]